MPSVWRWLHAREPFAPLGPPPPLAERARFTVQESGDLLVSFGASHEFALRFAFPPALSGESTVQIGTHMHVPLSALPPLIEVASRQLDTVAAAVRSEDHLRAFLVTVHVSRCSAEDRAGILGHVELFELEKPRVSLKLDFGFVEEQDVGAFKGGAGWFHFRGPRGKKSRETVVHFLAEMFAPAE